MDPSQLQSLIYLLQQGNDPPPQTSPDLVGMGNAAQPSAGMPTTPIPMMYGSNQQKATNPNPFVPQKTSNPFIPQMQTSLGGGY